MSEHAPFAPSSMARLVQCSGSRNMQRQYPEADGPEAQEGVAAHFVLAEMLLGRVVALGQIAPNGVVITEEMIEGAELAAEVINPHDGDGLNVERRISCAALHADCWGTPDAYQRVAHRRVRVADYKFGHGFVEVFENWQLITYAAGVLNDFQLLEHDDVLVELTIIQPRNYHRDGPVRSWSVLSKDLRPYWHAVSLACHAGDLQKPPTRVGPECKHCTARHACPTLQAAALDVVDTVGKSVALELTSAQAAGELRRLDYAVRLAESRRSGLEAQLLAALRSGQAVPFYHVEHGEGRETWAKTAPEVFALGDLMGVNLRNEKPITPAQARKRGVDVPGFSVRNAGEAKLVADAPHQAVKIFGGVK